MYMTAPSIRVYNSNPGSMSQHSTLFLSIRLFLLILTLGTLPSQPGNEDRSNKHPAHNNKSQQNIPRCPYLMLPNRIAHSPGPPCPSPQVLRRLRPEMSTRIKMIHRVPIDKRGRIILVSRSSCSLSSSSSPSATRRRGRLVSSKPAMGIKTRRRSPKRTTTFAQPAGRP